MISSGTQGWDIGFFIEHCCVLAVGLWIKRFRALCLSLVISHFKCDCDLFVYAFVEGTVCNAEMLCVLSLSYCSTHRVLLEERALVRRAGCGGQPS